MNQNEKLSLQEEVENEALRVEMEIANNPELQEIEGSDRMDASLLAKIQAYEKRREQKHSTEVNTAKNVEGHAPNFNECTNDNPESLLSEEDREALRLGREMLKKKEEEPVLFTVNPEYHKHLNSEKKEGKKNREGKTSVFRMPRGRRFIIAFAAVLVLVVGTSVTSVGSKSYLKELWDKVVGNEKIAVMNVKDMEKQGTEDISEIEAFKEIMEKLRFSIISFGYLPENMTLEKYKIDENQKWVQLFYQYNGEIIRYNIYLNGADSSIGQKEEDVLLDKFNVESTKQVIEVEEYEKKASKRYVANFEYYGVHYQLKGVMSKSDFTDIIENLIYFD